MKHYFLIPADIDSPRWAQAFSELEIFNVVDELPINLQGVLLWCHESILHQELIKQSQAHGAKVIVLVNAESPERAKYWLEQGALGYIHYGAAAEILLSVAQVVSLNGIWMGADLLRAIVQATHQQKPALTSNQLTAFQLSRLSQRELDVATLVSRGLTNKEIARDMDISERTVKAHLSSVFEKLQLRDRLQLALVMPK